jgi:phytoene dehydrogenase-like protein
MAEAGRVSDGYDAVVVGSGPNGLAAAITLARAGRSVLVLEAEDVLGGGLRSAELTRPGFIHDRCATIFPFGVASPFFNSLPLGDHPPAPLAHPLDDGSAVMLEQSVDETARGLAADAAAYRRLMGPLVAWAEALFGDVLAPFHLPRHPLLLARFGLRAVYSARGLARRWFQGKRARALLAGLAGHAILPLGRPLSAAVAVVLAVAGHAAGWPVARGGSGQVAAALASYLRSQGGQIVTGRRVCSLGELPRTRAILFDVAPRSLLAIGGERFPAGYCRALRRYRHGPGVCKVDWALDGPIPWQAGECARAATVHLGGTFEEIAAAELAVWKGEHPERPFVLLAQQSLFDPTRAPAGQHTGWAYCHVPSGSTFDMTARIEAQVERFAPGFRDRILARHITTPGDLERHNANLVGGDISGGVMDLGQLFTRPAARLDPYSTPAKGIYLCSASTPPGPGVHGMCGYFAARSALRQVF